MEGKGKEGAPAPLLSLGSIPCLCRQFVQWTRDLVSSWIGSSRAGQVDTDNHAHPGGCLIGGQGN